jgi:putative endopeptidase
MYTSPFTLRTVTTAVVLALLLASSARPADDPSKPFYGSWGYDFVGGDKNTRAGDDFFRFANGTWLDHTQIPADKPGVSLRAFMTDRTEERLRGLMEQAAAKARHQPADLEGKIGAFYRSFMDEAYIEKVGANPIAPELTDVRAAKSRDALAALMGRNKSDFEATLFNVGIGPDLKDAQHYAVYISQGGLGLPDRDYYLDPKFDAQKKKYQVYAAQLLHLIDWPDADACAKDIVDLETKVAEASWNKAQQRDPVATYNPMSIPDLQSSAPGFAWTVFFADAGLAKVTRVIVREKTAFPKLAALYAQAPIPVLQAWHAFHIADQAAPYLSKAFADAHFEMHDKTLVGQQEQKVRWKRAVFAVGGGDFLAGGRFGIFGTLGFGVGQIFTAKYFGPEAKAKIEALVTNLKAAFRVRVEKLDWMSRQTKEEAIKKLDTYTIKVGYPEHPRDYSGLLIADDDLVGDVRRAGAADWAFSSGRLFGPVDRSEWLMTPQTNDAYSGILRDIVFPAGILQPPMFDANADAAVNYGAIGAVIGHELTHGFDDAGRKIDAAGALRDWWAKEDAAKFEARAKKLGDQYSKFQPIPGASVNGELTMGENIADLGGLTLALEAYHASLGGKPAPVIDGFTGDQRVFLGWAQIWRGKVTDDYVRGQVVRDPHSPIQFRVNGVVRNIDAWYAAFGVQSDDRLYVAPDARIRIW